MKLTLEWKYIFSVLHSQYHACWCSGDFRSQGISRHGIDPQSWNIPSPAPEELTGTYTWYSVQLIEVGEFVVDGFCRIHQFGLQSQGNLTHCGMNQMDIIQQTTFSNACISFSVSQFRLPSFQQSFFLRVQLKISKYWFREWHGAKQVASHL